MAFHHLAVATRDVVGNHLFYSRAMGFELVKVEVRESPEGGWAKHFFYDTGDGEMMAFWELHGEKVPEEFPTGLSEAAGLPVWVNHIAFRSGSVAELEIHRKRWLEHGYDVLEIDHGWCHSVYTTDPNGTLVEWCVTTGEFDQDDRERALRALSEKVEFDVGKAKIERFRTEAEPVHRAGR
jgi:catechol 2,3-dioxygenase-like lactoylglutathione lyase family enzyme